MARSDDSTVTASKAKHLYQADGCPASLFAVTGYANCEASKPLGNPPVGLIMA
jgi:hypothetical protein